MQSTPSTGGLNGGGGVGMDIWDGSFINMYYPNIRVSFQSHKYEVVKWKTSMYTYNRKDGVTRPQ